MERKSEAQTTDIVLDMSGSSLYKLNGLLNDQLDDAISAIQNERSTANSIKSQIDDINSALSVDINEIELEELDTKIRDSEANLVRLEKDLSDKQNAYSRDVWEAKKLNSEYNSVVSKIVSDLEAMEDNDRMIAYINQTRRLLSIFKIRLQERKVNHLAETMTECYKKLANKKNLINKVRIDKETLNLSYWNKQKIEVPKSSLSAGEKQLMVISLLWALAICSKKKLPVIIDTPLSRLDLGHRGALITTYFPNASEQTIILSTDTEIDERGYELLKDNISDSYLLVYNDETRSSTIEKGYFKEITYVH